MTGCPPCKVLVNEQTKKSAEMAETLRDLIMQSDASPEAQDELLYRLAQTEAQFIRGVRHVGAAFADAIGAPPRWQVLLNELAGLPTRAVPGLEAFDEGGDS